MAREFPGVPFERFVDDVVVHCVSERQARQVRDAIAASAARGRVCELHPDKTRIVYCKDADRRGDHEVTSFTSWGTRSGRGWPRAGRPSFRVVPARDQHGGDEGDGPGDPFLAPGPAQ